jgi:hypothetical protein
VAIPTERLIREAKRIEEDTTYSAKRHFNACALWNWVHYLLGIPTVVIAAASATLSGAHHETVAGGLAGGAAILAALSTFLNPHQRAAAHAVSGNRYNALKNRARMFYELRCADPGATPDHLSRELADLGSNRDHLNEQSPATPRIAFLLARRQIEAGEASYAVDSAPPPST